MAQVCVPIKCSSTNASDLSVTVEGPKRVSPSVKAEGDRFFVCFTTDVEGNYTINVTCQGKPADNSPIKLALFSSGQEKPYEVDVPVTRTTKGGQVIAIKDITMKVEGPQKVLPKWAKQSGNTVIHFVTQTPGVYTVTCLHKGEHLEDSPKVITVSGEQKEGLQSITGGSQALAGLMSSNTTTATSTLQLAEIKLPIPLKMPGGAEVPYEEVEVLIDGPKAVVAELKKVGDDVFVCFESDTPGEYQVSYKHKGDHMRGSPQWVTVIPNKPAAQAAAIRNPVTFIISALDDDGKLIPDGAEKEVQVEVNGPEQVNVSITREESKHLAVTYNPSQNGNYKFLFTFRGRPLKHSPVMMRVKD